MCKSKPRHSPSKDGLKLLSFNIEGLASGLEDPSFIDLMYKHDICLLCETWKKDDSKINLPGWWDFSLVRPKDKKAGRHSGGISILCKEEYRAGIKVVESSEGFIWIKLDAKFFSLMNNLFLCAAYIPPQYSKNSTSKKVDYFQHLNDSIMKYSNEGNIMLMGDFNSRIGVDHNETNHDIPIIDDICPDELKSSNMKQRISCDAKVNAYGKKLVQLCQAFNLKVANGAVPGDRLGNFTCHANRGASVVDYAICDNSLINIISRLTVHPPQFESLHSPISTQLDTKFQIKTLHEDSLPPPPKFKWDASKSEVLSTLLDQRENITKLESLNIEISNTGNSEGLEKCVQELTNILFSNASNCLKLVKRRTRRRRKPNCKPWYNRDCYSLKKRLNNLAKLLLKSPKDPVIRGTFIKTKMEYKRCIKQQKKLYEIDNIAKLENLSNQPKKFWEYVKKMGNASKFGLGYGNYISKDTWLDHFRKLNKKDPALLPENIEYCGDINNKINDMLTKHDIQTKCEWLEGDFTLDEVKFGIKQLKRGKASGVDAISNDIIKTAKKSLSPILTTLFDKIVELKYFPRLWSMGILFPIHKSGELDDPNNFRGITLNSCLSKLFTYLLNTRLSSYCEEKGLMEYNQIGFRKGFRTSDHIFTLKTVVDKAFANKKKLYVCFVDFKKAYDTVWRNGLFYKLLKAGISPGFVQLMQSMYSKLQSCVQVGDGVSESFESLVGLKQGCNLSPCLFNLFVNQLIYYINDSNMDAPLLDNLQVSCLLYADDLVLLSETKEGLQKSLNALDKYTNEWFLEVNPKKTKCMVFSRGRTIKYPDVFNLGDKVLENCDSYCYLGVLFCKSGSMKMASKALHGKALGAMFSLLRNVNKHYACRYDIIIDLFDKMILPIALYNSEVWGTNFIPVNANNEDFFDITALSKHFMEKLQLKFLKMTLGVGQQTSNWATITETGRFPLIVRVFGFMIKYLFHLMDSPSNIVKAALDTNIWLANKGINTWYKSILRILKFCKLDHLLYTTDDKEIFCQIQRLKYNLNNIFIERWAESRSEMMDMNNNRLNILLDMKDTFEMSSYLKVSKFPMHRIAMTKFRISAHRLPIETGRYEQIPREERNCPFGCQQVGDEQHYIFQCRHPFMLNLRKEFMGKIAQTEEDTSPRVDDLVKLKNWLKSPSKSVVCLVGNYAANILKLFKELTI